MAKGTLNKVMLIGRFGADPELKYTPSGRAFVNFNLATNAVWKDQGGKQQERTDWHRIVAWGKLAEIIGEWQKKGSRVFIEGRLQTRDYEDNNGVKKYITEVVASNMEMLDSNGDNSVPGLPEESPAGGVEEEELPF